MTTSAVRLVVLFVVWVTICGLDTFHRSGVVWFDSVDLNPLRQRVEEIFENELIESDGDMTSPDHVVCPARVVPVVSPGRKPNATYPSGGKPNGDEDELLLPGRRIPLAGLDALRARKDCVCDLEKSEQEPDASAGTHVLAGRVDRDVEQQKKVCGTDKNKLSTAWERNSLQEHGYLSCYHAGEKSQSEKGCNELCGKGCQGQRG